MLAIRWLFVTVLCGAFLSSPALSQDQPIERQPPDEPRRAVPREPATTGGREAAPRPAERTAEPRRAPDDQRRTAPAPRPRVQPAPVVRGRVFIGGYFYDPMFGPYPWWRRGDYRYWYYPLYDSRASVRLSIAPREAEQAAVYVDGFYAGIVDDFNNAFQSLPLPPGGHVISIYLERFRTVTHRLYLRPGSTFTVRDRMEPLPPGVRSEPPAMAPPLPPPPPGSYQQPMLPPPALPAPPSTSHTVPDTQAVGFGTLDVWVRPAEAAVLIDGERWQSSEPGHFVVQVPAGTHQVEVTRRGYRPYSSRIQVDDGVTVPLNIGLTSAAP